MVVVGSVVVVGGRVVVVVRVRRWVAVIDTGGPSVGAGVVAGRGAGRSTAVGAAVARSRRPMVVVNPAAEAGGASGMVVALDHLAEDGGLGGRRRWPAAPSSVAPSSPARPLRRRDHEQARRRARWRGAADGRAGVALGRAEVGGHGAGSVPHRRAARQRSPEFRASPLRNGRAHAKITPL